MLNVIFNENTVNTALAIIEVKATAKSSDLNKPFNHLPIEKLTFEIGIMKFKLKDKITLVSRTIKTTYAAFSKSVNCTC